MSTASRRRVPVPASRCPAAAATSGRDVGHGDGHAQGRRRGAAGDRAARGCPSHRTAIAVPGHPPGAAAQARPGPGSGRACAAAASAARPTKSPGLPSLTTRPRPASNGVSVRSELVAVQRHPGLEAQRVPGRQAGRDQARGLAGRGQRRPEMLARLRGPGEQLEAVLARCSRSGRAAPHRPATRAPVAGVVLHLVQGRCSVSGRENGRRRRALDGDQGVVRRSGP